MIRISFVYDKAEKVIRDTIAISEGSVYSVDGQIGKDQMESTLGLYDLRAINFVGVLPLLVLELILSHSHKKSISVQNKREELEEIDWNLSSFIYLSFLTFTRHCFWRVKSWILL